MCFRQVVSRSGPTCTPVRREFPPREDERQWKITGQRVPVAQWQIYIYIYIYIYRSEGFPRTGYFVPACVGSGRWAYFESCSRIHACGFRCFCRKVWFRARGAHISRKKKYGSVQEGHTYIYIYILRSAWAPGVTAFSLRASILMFFIQYM